MLRQIDGDSSATLRHLAVLEGIGYTGRGMAEDDILFKLSFISHKMSPSNPYLRTSVHLTNGAIACRQLN